MPLTASISTDTIVVEPGHTAPLTVEITNSGLETNQVEVGVEGIDGEWIALPVSEVSLTAGEMQQVKVFFKPPRSSESIAGNFPYVIRVRSLIDGEQKTAQGILTIKPYHSLSLEISPRRGVVTSTRRQNIFTATLLNLGNSEHQVQLYADDPEETCAYEFDEETAVLRPGQQKDIDFMVNPKQGAAFGSSRLVGFIVTGRSSSVPGIAATSQGQLEIRPFLTPLWLVMITIFTLLGMIFWITQPKPPSIRLEVIGSRKVYQGSKFTVRWESEHANTVKLISGGELVEKGLPPSGTHEIDAPLLGTLEIQAVASRDRRESEVATVNVEVVEAPVIPDPQILELKSSASEVRKGERVTLTYKFNSAVTKATLAPNQIDLDLNLNTVMVDPTNLGDNEFTIVVENSERKIQKKSIKIKMIDPCLAVVSEFSASPKEVDTMTGRTTLKWVVRDAVRVELTYTGATTYEVESIGSVEVPIQGKTTFTLKAFDINGKSVLKTVTVVIKDPPPVDIVPTVTTGGETANTAGSTAGTATTGN